MEIVQVKKNLDHCLVVSELINFNLEPNWFDEFKNRKYNSIIFA